MTSHPSQTAGKRRILIVDDDERITEMLCSYLVLHGFEAHCANNGMSAIHLLNTGEKSFDMVITDYDMPEMGGIELVKTIRSSLPSRTIIGMSGLSSTEKDFMNAGANGFFSKPFELQDILWTISSSFTGAESGT